MSVFQNLKERLLAKINYSKNTDFYLKKIKGIIHVGGNEGQEREIYARHGLNVLWVEPIPEVFERLKKNIEGFPHQVCLNHLVTDVDDREFTFHISNNSGLSSSIFDLAKHRDLWPEVDFARDLQIRGVTLKTLVQRNQVSLELYDALVLDTQGAELLILKGAEDMLSHFKYIQAEVADFESYKGGCTLAEFDAYLKARGFRCVVSKYFARRDSSTYYNNVYARI